MMKKQALAVVIVAFLAVVLPSCNQNYLIFEEDEWSGADFNGENLLLNGELELDDYDR